MKKITAALILSFLCSFYVFSFVFIQPIKAVTVTSTAVTRVGNPPLPAGSNGNVLKAAQDLFAAYHGTGCPPTTEVTPALSQCLEQGLLSEGYPQGLVDQIASYSNMVSNFRSGAGLVECIQFVRQVIILAYGATDPRLGPGSNGNTPYNWSSMDNNGSVLTNLGHTTPQPGDIAVNPGGNSDDTDTTFGHISIVTSVSDPYFTATEANFIHAHVTNNYSTHPIADYVFFRQQ